jgi:hypothetical protein
MQCEYRMLVALDLQLVKAADLVTLFGALGADDP